MRKVLVADTIGSVYGLRRRPIEHFVAFDVRGVICDAGPAEPPPTFANAYLMLSRALRSLCIRMSVSNGQAKEADNSRRGRTKSAICD
jgi:hypothetical protein